MCGLVTCCVQSGDMSCCVTEKEMTKLLRTGGQRSVVSDTEIAVSSW